MIESHHAIEQSPRLTLWKQPLWLLSGQLGVILLVVLGFGAVGIIKPKLAALLLLVCVAGAIVLGPIGRLGKVVIAAPVASIVVWWTASFLWTFNVFGWWTSTQILVPLILSAVVFVGVLPQRALERALVLGCYVAIANTVFEIAMRPGLATVNPDGVPGWRGGFIHKNAMGPFMLFALLVLFSFERPSWSRRIAIACALLFAILAQSTTTIGAGIIVGFLFATLRIWGASSRRLGVPLAFAALGATAALAAVHTVAIPLLLGTAGKDSTLTSRTSIWAGVLEAIDKHPWIGYGAGGVWGNPAAEPGRSILRGLGFTVYHSHNGFLEILLLFGVVGLALIIWLYASTVQLGLANVRSEPGPAAFCVAYVALCVVLSITEVATLGIWLAMACAANCLILKVNVNRIAIRNAAAPHSRGLRTAPDDHPVNSPSRTSR